MTAMRVFAERLKKIRESRNLSQRAIALGTGLSPAQISRYESGERTPTEEAIRRIAQFLGVSADYLLGLTDDPAPKGKEFNLADYLPSDIKEAPQALRQLARQIQDWAEKLEKVTKEDEDGKRAEKD
ncbi:hypothetical protein DRP07_11155 [Archaeoglobales archaeon]|nr:MAG: hypothetical protein DRP07_11155 [Archaeoglobales archaeon]